MSGWRERKRRGTGRAGWALLPLAALAAGLTACGGGVEPAGEGAGTAVTPPAAVGEAGMAALVATSPADEVTLGDGFRFAWDLPEGASGGVWRIVVFAGGSQPLWESPRMTFTEFQAPPALLLKLERGRAYTWHVRGNLNAGGRATTPEMRFVAR